MRCDVIIHTAALPHLKRHFPRIHTTHMYVFILAHGLNKENLNLNLNLIQEVNIQLHKVKFHYFHT